VVSLQILNKVINDGSVDIIQKNNLTADYFIGYENEYDYILNHYREYAKTPDKETFLDKFHDWVFMDVFEPEKYLVEKINEEYIYYQTVPIIQKAAEILKTDSVAAVDYIRAQVTNGGLLIAVKEDAADQVRSLLVSAGLSDFTQSIGRFTTKKEKVVYVK
jgi:hypothetical protein